MLFSWRPCAGPANVRGVHEVATLFALTQNPCQKWEDLGYGKAALIYQRTQQVLKAARLLPAHQRLPHQAFLSGLWWKLLSLQPLRLLAYLPGLGCLRPVEQEDPIHFTVNGFSAGSCTGAVICLSNSLPLASQSDHSASRCHCNA